MTRGWPVPRKLLVAYILEGHVHAAHQICPTVNGRVARICDHQTTGVQPPHERLASPMARDEDAVATRSKRVADRADTHAYEVPARGSAAMDEIGGGDEATIRRRARHEYPNHARLSQAAGGCQHDACEAGRGEANGARNHRLRLHEACGHLTPQLCCEGI